MLSWPDGGRNPSSCGRANILWRALGIISEAYLTSSCPKCGQNVGDSHKFGRKPALFERGKKKRPFSEFRRCGQASQLCNVPLSVSFFSPEREFSYILVGQPHPEGWGEDERRRGGDRRKARWECSILGNMRRAKREQAEPRWTSSLSIVQEHKSTAGWRPPVG